MKSGYRFIIWIPQEVVEEKIYRFISFGCCSVDYRVIVSGETKNIALYLIRKIFIKPVLVSQTSGEAWRLPNSFY